MKLRVAGMVNDSVVDGPGWRFTVFVQGCPHCCPGCHNPHTHDFNGGEEIETADVLQKVEANPLLDGVTFSGGEPFCQAAPLAELGQALKKKGYDIITYTGFTFEELFARAQDDEAARALLAVTDLLIDGPFLQEQKRYDLRFRGSVNQRILDCPKSMEQGRPCKSPLLE